MKRRRRDNDEAHKFSELMFNGQLVVKLILNIIYLMRLCMYVNSIIGFFFQKVTRKSTCSFIEFISTIITV